MIFSSLDLMSRRGYTENARLRQDPILRKMRDQIDP